MGQYHYTVNLDKREFINPHKLGDGLKLLEQYGYSPGGTNDALHLLLACSSGRGGGDFQSDDKLIGHWAGDRIAVVGDYAEDKDLAPEHEAGSIYDLCGSDDPKAYRDITDELIPVMEREYEIVYIGDRAKLRVDLSSVIKGYQGSHGVGDRMAQIDGRNIPMSRLREAVRRAYDIKEANKKLTLADLQLEQ